MSTAKEGHIQCSEATFDALESALPYLQIGPIVLPPPKHLACWPRASPQAYDLLVARAAPPVLLHHALLASLAGRPAMPSLAMPDSGRTSASSAQYVTDETARDMISARLMSEWPSARHPTPFALASTLPTVAAGGVAAGGVSSGPAVVGPPYPASDVSPTPPTCPEASSKASPLLQRTDAHSRHERRSSVLGLSVVDFPLSHGDASRLPSAESVTDSSVTEDVSRFSRGPEAVLSAATFVDSRAGSPSLHHTAYETEQRLLNLIELISKPKLEALLKEGESEHVPITLHEDVAVLFADIQGFTAMCEGSDSAVLIQQLHELYTSFDGATTDAGLWKVDTVRFGGRSVTRRSTLKLAHCALLCLTADW